MLEENKERLSKTEYDKIGDMLLELMAECPHVPKSLKNVKGGILYDEIGAGMCVFVLTDSGRRKEKYISGTLIAELNMRIAYQIKPSGNGDRIDAQEITNKIVEWFCDLENLPKLADGTKITKFEASPISSFRYDTTKDGYVAYASNVAIECKMKGELK